MIDNIKLLIEALREELQEYGEMLALLDRQQEHLLARAVTEVFQSISLIKAQGAVLQRAREHRDDCRRRVAQEAGQQADSTFADLIQAMPHDYQPLLKALVEENNELLMRVRRRARLNHLMLHRSVELMQDVLNTLMPVRKSSVYDGSGQRQPSVVAPRPLYEAVG